MISLNLKRIIAKKPKILNLFQLGRSFSPFPLFYLVHLTLACNARCQFCYQKDSAFDASRNEFLKISDFGKILKQARSFLFKKPLIYFFGGEPLLHPQFEEFLELARHFPCALTTNGILLNRYFDKIGAAGNLRQINVSLCGPAEIHDKIIGRNGAFEDTIFGIRRLQESSRRQKIININCVIHQENFDKLAIFADFLNRYFHNREISALVFQFPIQGEICRQLNTPTPRGIIAKIKKMRFDFDVYFSGEGWFKNYRQNPAAFLAGNCNIPWLGLGILPNLDILSGGSVLTCAEVLGNLNEKSLKEIWNGQNLRNLRKQILKQGLPADCRGCCHAQI